MIQPPLIVFARAVEIGFAESEAGEDALGLRFDLVAAELGVLAQRVVIFLGVGLAGARAVGKDAHEPPMLRRDGAGQFEHGLVAARGRFLRQIADGRVLVDDHGAAVGLGRAEDDGEKGRLARAVRPDQRDAFPEIDAQGNVFKKRARAEALADFGQGKHKRASLTRSAGQQQALATSWRVSLRPDPDYSPPFPRNFISRRPKLRDGDDLGNEIASARRIAFPA